MNDRELLSTDAYLALSAEINYQLSAKRLNQHALLSLILGQARPPGDMALLVDAVDLVQLGYQQRRRRLGPAAVLHPLRTAAILVRSMRQPTMLDFLGALLHDKDEDICEADLGPEKWSRFNRGYHTLLKQIDRDHRWYLGERIALLTRRDHQTYNAYLGEILDHARCMPDLLHVKMADRLDNTFDVSVARPGVTRYNFFRSVFDVMFVPVYRGVNMEEYHFLPDEREGVQILSNLFKNTIFLSLLRQDGLSGLDDISARLTDALSVASIRVAQWVALEIFASEITDVVKQQLLLREVMAYCSGGGITAVTHKQRGGVLDGTFVDRYPMGDAEARKKQLAELYGDKEMLAKLAVVFIAIFSCFLNDPKFYIRGIDREGVWAVE